MPRLGLILLPVLAMGAVGTPAAGVFIAGDASASQYTAAEAPREGWGQRLQSYLDPTALQVRNHARREPGARRFIAAGALAALEAQLGRGDILLIQFEADADQLMRFVEAARRRQATPILLTPPARRSFGSGQPAPLLESHAEHAAAVRALAGREAVALIDLHASSGDLLRALGAEASRAYYVPEPGEPRHGDSRLRRIGAYALACLVVDGWKRISPAMARHVVRDTDCGARPTALADLAAQPHPSLVVHEREFARAQPGPHGGAGETTGHALFAGVANLGFVVRKRVLHPGAGIGLHQHDHDEIYYVISGQGVYTTDGRDHEVGPGHAMLVRTGSTHAIRQAGDEDLVLLIAYPQ